MRVSRLACCLLLVVPVLSAEAGVYRYIDKHGNQVFTDSPPEGAEKVETKPVMTMPFPRARESVAPDSVTAQQKRAAVVAYTVTLSNPPADAVYRRGEGGGVPVAVSVSPSLEAGHQLEVLLDGNPWEGNAIPLSESMDRGTHTLLARVVDAKGNVLASSPTVSFHVQHQSSLGPTAPKPKPKPKS